MLVTDPGKYAKAERERRFLVPTMPTGLGEPWEIHDRYIIGTRLRLRRVDAAGGTVLKLGQKIRPDEDSPEVVLCTSLYMSQGEYDNLVVLPAHLLGKTRYRMAVADFVVCVDVFHDSLEGLALAEVDLATEPSNGAAFDPPVWCGPEVTSDQRFTGGALAALDADGAQRLLDEVAANRIAAELHQTTLSNRATYDRIAMRYAENQDRLVSGNERAFPELLRAFVASLPENGTIADLGCGPGRDATRFVEAGFNVLGVDLSAGMLALAPNAMDGRLAQADLRALPIHASTLDGIWCCASLLHVPVEDTLTVLREFHRTLASGGILALVTALGDSSGFEAVPYAPGEQRWFVYRTPGTIADQLQSAGFTITSSASCTGNREWGLVLAATS